MLTNLERILKFGVQGFLRNKGLSFQVIFTMVIAISVFSSLFVINDLSDFLIDKARERVDISVYFNRNVSQEEITSIKENLSSFSDNIEDIRYVSKEEAKDIFIERHQNDDMYLEALNEVGGNPFLPSLNIKARSPGLYAQISEFLSTGPFKDSVEKISYYESEKVIARLFSFTEGIQKGGLFLSLFLVILVFLINFNTVRLTIMAFKDEISTMKLVGASNWFVRGPFLVQGVLYAILSIILVDVALFALFSIISSGLQSWLFGFNLLEYFQSNFLMIFLWQIVFGILLGLISSFLAVRRYLKV